MEKSLYHHGVKGMKWGVRRTPAQLGHKTTSSKKKKTGLFSKSKQETKKKTVVKSTEHTEQKPKKKSVKEMTDQELMTQINRMRLEQQYAQLTPKKASLGKRFINSAINDVVIPGVKDGTRVLIADQTRKRGNAFIDDMFKAMTDQRKKNG